jgi:hypothetical protein
MIETDSAGFPIVVDDLDDDWLLSLVEDAETQARAAERRKLRYAAQWCRLHLADRYDERDERVGGDGTPAVAEFAAEPFGAALQISTHAARQLMADALNLQHRLPLIWARVEALDVPAWRACRNAQATGHLTRDAAAVVDRELAARAGTCGVTLIDRAIAAAEAHADPAEQHAEETLTRGSWDVRLFHGPAAGHGRWVGTSILEITGDTLELTRLHDNICATADQLARDGDDEALEVRKAKAVGVLTRKMDGGRPPRTKLFLHADLDDLTDDTIGPGSAERLGPATMTKIKDWVGRSQVTILPVLRMDRADAQDRRHPPTWMRELVTLRDPHCVLPWCSHDARSCDLDHIEPYVDPDHGGPPGQTNPANLAPLCRRHHRAKTKRHWHYQRHPDGTYAWTSSHGRRYAVTPSGTYPLG